MPPKGPSPARHRLPAASSRASASPASSAPPQTPRDHPSIAAVLNSNAAPKVRIVRRSAAGPEARMHA